MENLAIITECSSRQRWSRWASRVSEWDHSESGKSWGDRVTSLSPPFSKGLSHGKELDRCHVSDGSTPGRPGSAGKRQKQ